MHYDFWWNLPLLLQRFEAIPSPATNIDVSLDEKYLYSTCWGLGEMHLYDVPTPRTQNSPARSSLAASPVAPSIQAAIPSASAPKTVEISCDGKRVYLTIWLHPICGKEFNPNNEGGQTVLVNVGETSGFTLDKNSYVDLPKGHRSHQIRLEGGDCSTNGFC